MEAEGIGAEITKTLARAGAHVVFTYSNSQDGEQALLNELYEEGITIKAVQVNNIDTSELSKEIDRTVLQYGGLDILINNAGIFIGKAFKEYTMEDYEITMNINVRGAFAACLAAAKHMTSGSRIVIIGSNMADFVGRSNATLYTMSKSALQGLARDLGPEGITANVIQPGPIDTEMNPATSPKAELSISKMALSAYGTVTDIADLVAFLVSKEAQFITGPFITINGGFNA